MLRPARPEKARVTNVCSGRVLAIASAHAAGSFASGQRKNPVPIWTADAPKMRAAATPRAGAPDPDGSY